MLLYVLGLHAAEVVQMLQAVGSTQPIQGRILQGRYCPIPIAPLFVALGLAGLRAWSRRFAFVGAAVLIGVWFVISLAALNTVIHFYAT